MTQTNTLKSVLTKHQKREVTLKNLDMDDQKVDLVIELRYDDECGNGHNSFAITGDIYKAGCRDDHSRLMCGCIHEEIEKYAPKYAKYIKWHLMSSDGPMHYTANTLYHAGDKDGWGKRKGEPKGYYCHIQFDGHPITYKIKESFKKFIEEQSKPLALEIVTVHHTSKDGYTFSPKYTFSGYKEEWHECPYDEYHEAYGWKVALEKQNYEFIRVPYGCSEGKEPDLEAARRSAIAPEATLKQLQSKTWLEARLPELQKQFKAAMEELGFVY